MSSAHARTMYLDRADAGRRLAAALQRLNLHDPVVYGLPRGGVPVAFEVAKALKAPLEVLLVRKIGAPGHPEVALAAVVDGQPPQVVVNEDVMASTNATQAYLEENKQRELVELRRRRALYVGTRARVSPEGRTVIVVDDGLATGATAKSALQALRRLGAARLVLAVPVAAASRLDAMRSVADMVVCPETPVPFYGVGAFYDDFHQLTDDEVQGLLAQAWAPAPRPVVVRREVRLPPLGLLGDLQIPTQPRGIVIFAHGSGSSRRSPRNRVVADDLNARGFATLLFDLLSDKEAADRRNVFDIDLLAERLALAVAWVDEQPDLAGAPLGLFGASTGAAAALSAAAKLGKRVSAVVSRGGRPDLAGAALDKVEAATLLIVGGADVPVIPLNRNAFGRLSCDKKLSVVPDAGHLFEEPGTLDQVISLAGRWFEEQLPAEAAPGLGAGQSAVTSLSSRVRAAAEPLPDIEDPAFGAAFDRFAESRVVLLGEASHGTSEFYRARAAITRRLIEKHGFEIVAIEADWPDAASIDRYVRGKPQRPMEPPPFSRFPTWMWRNREMEAFVRWLREWNADAARKPRVGVYGLDLYNMRASMAEVLAYLDKVDPVAAAQARERYACLSPWRANPAAYGRAALSEGYALCEKPVLRILMDLARKAADYAAHDGENHFDATQNARLVADAESYYRAMYYGAHESWNLRDRHMFGTLQHVLARRGPTAKAVVWAHNSHIGDARYTEMGAARNELNLGQLCRERFGAEAALIGFGTNRGAVMAASEWDGPAEVKEVRGSRSDSFERVMHDADIPRFLLDFRAGRHDAIRQDLREPRLERYIGVIYRPETERASHYSLASLSDQYDAFIWFDETKAVTPLATAAVPGEDETYPFGF